MPETRLSGFAICPGIAIGKPLYFLDVEEKIPEVAVADHQIEGEVARYYHALQSSEKDVLSLQQRFSQQGAGETAAILGSHLEMMRDPEMSARIVEEIRNRGRNSEYVFKTVAAEYEVKFNRISDEFFRERLRDFQDITRRILAHLRKKERPSLAHLSSKVIVFAHELAPSDTAEAKTDFIEAFVTQGGSETSHVAIMARGRNIPFVSNVNFPDPLLTALPECVIVDGRSGEVILNPTEETLQFFDKEKKLTVKSTRKVTKGKAPRCTQTMSCLSQTLDGGEVHLSVNIGQFNELSLLSEQFEAEQFETGVGLFRSEYLFLARGGFPTEEEQFEIYKELVERVGGYPAVIRAFDVGGDKLGHFDRARHEKNPYLGCRGIRLLLKEKNVFKAQIRAVLRASAFGEARLLFPMISCVTELRQAKALVEEVKEDLVRSSIPFSRKMAMGCMVEVPSAAMTADLLAKECDFLSIGTNDLVQYALAVDRGNLAMNYLYNPAHPSILRLIKMTVEAAKEQKIPVTICGEVAADCKFTALLLGLGLTEFSVALPALPLIKNKIATLSLKESVELATHILTLNSSKAVEEELERAHKE